MRVKYVILLFSLFLSVNIVGQNQQYTQEDTLFGSNTAERAWWDVTFYHLNIEVFPAEKSISGSTSIQYKVLQPHQILQIELQPPLKIEKIQQDGRTLNYNKTGFSYFVQLEKEQFKDEINKIEIHYSGKPQVSMLPPWEGGITWDKDSQGNPFIASTCQGDGASIWWPCKDYPGDEADSVLLSVTVPDSLIDVSNGRLRFVEKHPDSTHTFHWFVSSPINNYGININIGNYVHFSEIYHGLKGELECNYYVLEGNLEKAKEQFKQVPKMLEAFEYWFGPYPFYEDGYKLVQAPYLGMEHQSSVTYGNAFANGYLGADLSGTGWGKKFDFIIVHESGHEWFANNITVKDVTDLWVHEGFTNYSESLFLEYYFGDTAAAEYLRGLRYRIKNREPLIGNYGVRDEAPGDIYYKGANMLHTLRQVVNDKEKWRSILRGLNTEFYHQTVTSAEIEDYINSKIEIDLKPFFDQYLRTTDIPKFEYTINNGTLRYRYKNVVPDFHLPLRIYVRGKEILLEDASDKWNEVKVEVEAEVEVDRDYYIHVSSL